MGNYIVDEDGRFALMQTPQELAANSAYLPLPIAKLQGSDSLEIVTNESEGPAGDKCDVNSDGRVDVADIATVITRMAQLARHLKVIQDTEE